MTVATTQDMARTYIARQPRIAVVYDAGKWWRFFENEGWVEITQVDMENDIMKFLWDFHNGQTGMNVTDYMKRDVLSCVRGVLAIPRRRANSLDETVFLNFHEGDLRTDSAEGYIATRSHHIHVPTVAKALARGEEIPADAIRRADSRLFTTGMVPCDFDPQATCPRWEQFVAEACPTDGDMLQKMFGLTLTYDRRYNVFFPIFGPAGTGKSTALDMLASLCAGTTCALAMRDFCKEFDTYCLTVNRLNLVRDMGRVTGRDSGSTHREEVLKILTAGEPGIVRVKYVDPMTRNFRALFVFGCNTLPDYEDRSQAIADRMRIISFPNVFRGTSAEDGRLLEKLKSELPGILLWSLKAYGELLLSGNPVFPETLYSQALKAELIQSTRPEKLFCDEYLEPTDAINANLSTMRVYDEYQRYCKRCNYPVASEKTAITKIAECLQVEKRRTTVAGQQAMCFIGVRWRDDSAS